MLPMLRINASKVAEVQHLCCRRRLSTCLTENSITNLWEGPQYAQVFCKLIQWLFPHGVGFQTNTNFKNNSTQNKVDISLSKKKETLWPWMYIILLQNCTETKTLHFLPIYNKILFSLFWFLCTLLADVGSLNSSMGK